MSQRKHDRGMVYLLVLVTAGVTVSMGMLAVFAAAAQREVQELAIERERAALRAEAGIQIALAAIGSNDAWRSAAGGQVVATQTMDRGELTVAATDADGVLDDEATDPFTLTATATYGKARQKLAADFEIELGAVEALEYALVAQGGVTNTGSINLDFGDVEFTLSTLLLDSLNPWSGAKDMDDIGMPDPGVIAQYETLGTVLPLSMSSGGTGTLYEDLLLTIDDAESKEDRTTPNADRVYVIDGRGGPVLLNELTLVGTLVVVNATSLEITRPKTMRPSAEGHPLLLTAAPLTLNGVSKQEMSSKVKGEDPREGGPDFDQNGNRGAQGPIYVDNNVTIVNGMDMIGTLMSTGEVFIAGNVSIERNDAFLASPPPGFRSEGGPKLIAGSWRAIVD